MIKEKNTQQLGTRAYQQNHTQIIIKICLRVECAKVECMSAVIEEIDISGSGAYLTSKIVESSLRKLLGRRTPTPAPSLAETRKVSGSRTRRCVCVCVIGADMTEVLCLVFVVCV